jgi:phosphoribosylglycinamide formyltransferase 1
MSGKLKLAVLLSGSGTSLQNLVDRAAAGTLPVEIVVVVASRADAYGLERAKMAGIPTAVVPSREYKKNWDAHSAAVTAVLDRYKPGLIVLAGYMCLYKMPPQYVGRVMNVHPALIPAFCGHGLFGHIVHEKVIEYGVKVTGCTVHFADNQYDHGPIILQRTVAVNGADTPDTLAERVQAEEREAYPEAIRLFAEGRLRIEGTVVRVLPGVWRPTSYCGLPEPAFD